MIRDLIRLWDAILFGSENGQRIGQNAIHNKRSSFRDYVCITRKNFAQRFACTPGISRNSMVSQNNSRGRANQAALKLLILGFFISGLAIGAALVAMNYVPVFGRFWEFWK